MTVTEPIITDQDDRPSVGIAPQHLLDALQDLGLTVIATGDTPIGDHVVLPFDVVQTLLAEGHSNLRRRYITDEQLAVVNKALQPYKRDRCAA